MSITPSAPPGWYDDGSGRQRWWDGIRWTDHYGQIVPAVGYAPAATGYVSPKSRTVASILGFFLGGIGVDRFYLGNVGMGVAKLFVGWLTLGIWPLIDWIIILTGNAHDGQGYPVTRWE